MRYCILVAGPPASGKSTLGRRLARDLQLPFFSKDEIKETLFDSVGFRSRAEKVALGVTALEMLLQEAEAQLQMGTPCILENNFEDSSRPAVMELLARCGAAAITVRLTGDYPTLYRRFAAREQSPERHRGHVVNDRYPEPPDSAGRPVPLLPYESYLRGIETRGFDRFEAGGPLITVDMTDLARVDYPALLQQLKTLLPSG